MPLRGMLTSTWDHIQGFLFPMLREEVGPLTAQHERLVLVLDVARIEAFVRMWPGLPGRPLADRHALARAFVAKAVLNLSTTSGLIERLTADATLRRPDLQALLPRIAFRMDKHIPARFETMHIEATIELTDGRTLTVRCDGPRGVWGKPPIPEAEHLVKVEKVQISQ